MELKEWIRAARAHKQMTQTQLGDELGVSKGNVSAWEVGRHEPSFGQLQRIAELTGYALLANDVAGKPEQPKRRTVGSSQTSTVPNLLDFRTAAFMSADAWEDETEREFLLLFCHEVSRKMERMAESARNVKSNSPL